MAALPAWAMPVKFPNGGAEKANGDMPADIGVWSSAGVKATFRCDTAVKRSGDASFYIRNDGTDAAGSAGSELIEAIECHRERRPATGFICRGLGG